MDIACLFLNNVNCIEIYEIAPTGISTLLEKMTISRSDPATVQLTRSKEEWHIVQSNFSCDETPTMGGVPKNFPEVKIAVNLTRTTRGRLFCFLPLPIFTGFPVHVHALFGIDASRTNLRRDSVGLASGSRDQ
jgi:sacsin